MFVMLNAMLRIDGKIRNNLKVIRTNATYYGTLIDLHIRLRHHNPFVHGNLVRVCYWIQPLPLSMYYRNFSVQHFNDVIETFHVFEVFEEFTSFSKQT